VLDIEDTDDAVHGQQQLALFNTHAGGYCFQPIKIFEATTGWPVLSLQRPSKRPTGEDRAPHLTLDAASAALALSFNHQRVANVPQHPPLLTRLMLCACIPRIIQAGFAEQVAQSQPGSRK
jgi:hypothetical protein